jgi:hypothetical protein
MSVYIDPAFDHGSPSAPRCFRGVKSCHMYADTMGELHDMARRIGLKREWFQDDPSLQHYDLVPTKRAAAVAAGAVEHARREAVEKWRELRKKRIAEIEESKGGRDVRS